MNDERRKMLTDKMGECWHEWERSTERSMGVLLWKCKNCGLHTDSYKDENRTFDNPNDFFALWNWAKEQEWWNKLIMFCENKWWNDNSTPENHWPYVICPVRFPELLAEFLEGRK